MGLRDWGLKILRHLWGMGFLHYGPSTRRLSPLALGLGGLNLAVQSSGFGRRDIGCLLILGLPKRPNLTTAPFDEAAHPPGNEYSQDYMMVRYWE